MTIRVLLVDDQPLLLQGFAMILSIEDDIEVVGQVTDGAKAVAAVPELRPDVVLMDVQMPVLDGIEATRQIAAASTDVKIIILTTFDRDDYLFDALTAGASGFLLKNADADDIVDAIRTVAQGHALLAPEVTRRVIGAMTTGGSGSAPASADAAAPVTSAAASPAAPAPEPLPQLTSREREVLVLVAKGLSNAEIAQQVFVSEATIKTHVSNILAKLGVRDRVQAVVSAYDSGLVRPG
ncbi:response regulator transcription factor [Ornithinimicrobium sufpigmenti]|uniref:response regulator transcription factor n=1 Tax=Ornithinimicrobium sufpigmenti TaxID=2508882 RepID=UPI00235471D9|nr:MULTISPECIES: response regulator transcription factor [unclassified Ornithinimicrobium]